MGANVKIVDIPNPHRGTQRSNDTIEGVVLHGHGEWVVDANDAAGQGRGCVWHCTDWLRAIGLSCHAWALPDGRIIREVDSRFKASHAAGYNRRSVGIEFVLEGVWPYDDFQEAMDGNRPEAAYTDAQIRSGAEWVRARSREHGFPLTDETVWTHSGIAPGRKRDPGVIFPLAEFRALL